MTELVYLSNMSLLEIDATVTSLASAEDSDMMTLDRTVFYPQGGGQPFDTGTIEGANGHLVVTEVTWRDGRVHHIGSLSGSIDVDEKVRLRVDAERRALNTRLHSAGHLVDMAIDRIGLGWIPGKGYHFPQGPYVEYRGSLAQDKSELIKRIESTARDILGEAHRTETRFVERDELERLCRFVPDFIPGGKPTRVVMYGEFGVACGGTHVSELHEIGTLTIRKIKAKGDVVRVSYAVE